MPDRIATMEAELVAAIKRAKSCATFAETLAATMEVGRLQDLLFAEYTKMGLGK